MKPSLEEGKQEGGSVEDDGKVTLTREQVDMLVEALSAQKQMRKGRRMWLVNMLGRSGAALPFRVSRSQLGARY